MRVELRGVSKGRNGQALPPADVEYASGEAVLAIAETEQRPTVLGLIASGRMRPDAGSVTIDGAADGADLRRRVALVDAPPVCDPEPNVTVTAVTEEELMFAGRTSNPKAARRWLAEHGFAHLARLPIGDLPPRERIALLMQLTAMRPDVEGLVLVSPDRHRGEPAEWWAVAQKFAADGYAVLVVAGAAAARVLGLLPDPLEQPPVVERAERDETQNPADETRFDSGAQARPRSTTEPDHPAVERAQRDETPVPTGEQPPVVERAKRDETQNPADETRFDSGAQARPRSTTEPDHPAVERAQRDETPDPAETDEEEGR